MDAHPASERPATARSLEMRRGSRNNLCGWPLPRNVIISLQFSEGRKRPQKGSKKKNCSEGSFLSFLRLFAANLLSSPPRLWPSSVPYRSLSGPCLLNFEAG